MTTPTKQYNFILNAPIALATGWDDSTVSLDELSNVTKIYYPVDNTTTPNINNISMNYSNIVNETDVGSVYIPTISQSDFQNLYTTNSQTLLSFTIGQYIQNFINGDTSNLVPSGLITANTTILNDLQNIDSKTYNNLNYSFTTAWNNFINALQMQNISNIPNLSNGNIVMFEFTFVRSANTNVIPNVSLYTKHLLVYFKVQ